MNASEHRPEPNNVIIERTEYERDRAIVILCAGGGAQRYGKGIDHEPQGEQMVEMENAIFMVDADVLVRVHEYIGDSYGCSWPLVCVCLWALNGFERFVYLKCETKSAVPERNAP